MLLAFVLWARRKPRSRRGTRALSPKRTPLVPSRPAPPPELEEAVVNGESTPIPASLAELTLLTQETMTEEGRQLQARICAELQEPHPVQRQLAIGLDDPEDLIEVVSSDAGLSADVLRTVNSAAFSLVEPITSVPQAVNYLGVNVVKGLVLRATLRQTSPDPDPAQEQALVHVWQSACSASAMARLLALELGRPRPSILGTQTLFFNIGDVALLRCFPGAEAWYREGISVVDRIHLQQEHCGLNGALLGAALVRQWGLPEEIGAAIERGYLPLTTGPADHPLRGDERIDNILLYLASRIGDRMTYHGLRDISSLDLTPGTEPSLYWLGAHLHAARIGRAMDLLYTPGFTRKANRVLGAFADRRQGG